MFERIWDLSLHFLEKTFLPLVCIYHLICSNPFLNVSVSDAQGLEKGGNLLLTPFQYIFGGKEAIFHEDGSFSLVQRFDYSKNLAINTLLSVPALPSSLLLGSILKGASFYGKNGRDNYNRLLSQLESSEITPKTKMYGEMGLDLSVKGTLFPQGYLRRPGDENHLLKAKDCLKEIGKILNEANIPWWVDCGTLLGSYRYGGVIPWDGDIDIALLLPDFENVRKAFNKLDKEKYSVQDWSGREFPNTFMKVYIKDGKEFIDIYFYTLDPANKECAFLFSLDQSLFFPEWFKVRERRFTKPIAFNKVFPLKTGSFDGIEVFVPNSSEEFLQRYYGENLNPAKIFDPVTGRFEKDLTHPYWKTAFVH